jgi:microcompartment protein CcmL/EutN
LIQIKDLDLSKISIFEKASIIEEKGMAITDNALGLIETKGFAAMVEASDAMAKAAHIDFIGYKKIGGGYITAIIRGDVAAVKAALDAGKRAAERVGEIISVHIIPRPHESVDAVLPLGRKKSEK